MNVTAPPCAQCEKPECLCVCDTVTPVDNRVFALILRHPQEQDRALGSARLAALQLRNSLVKTGLSWPGLGKILDRPVDQKRWGVLYLGSAGGGATPPARALSVVSRQGAPVPDQDERLAQLEGIILLDGSWAQAKALWWRNPWLLKCQRLVLHPPQPSLYGKLRKEPRRESVSTIEAAAFALAAIEADDRLAEHILAPFRTLLRKARSLPRERLALLVPQKKKRFSASRKVRGKSSRAPRPSASR